MDKGFPMGAALWLGVLTSVSPCLLATHVAAIAFIARRVDNPRNVLLSGLLYTAGQMLAYVVLGALLVSSLLSMPVVSFWLQEYMTRLLGPLLLATAAILLEWVSFPMPGGRLKEWAQARAEAGGLSFAFFLGVFFALSFCPVTAMLFFGNLLPLAVGSDSAVLLPLLFALGVALPVVGFALLIALSAGRVGAVYTRIGKLERRARQWTGAVFLLIGVYFTWAFTFGAR